MNLQAASKVFADFDAVLRKASKNDTCLIPGCSEEPIGSHVIARKTLKLIAEKSEVLAWLTRKVSVWDIAKTINAGKPVEQLNEEPVSVGIGDKSKVTDPLFCHDHDESVFAPLEKREFSFQPEQVVLLAYRSLCFMTFIAPPTKAVLEVAKRHGEQNVFSTPERLARLLRFQATDIVVDACQRYEQIRKAQDYSQLGWSMYLVNMQPCIAATISLIPANGDDTLAIVNGTQTLTAEDVINFSFLPYTPVNSICVISWLKGSQRAHRFMNLSRINELTEEEQQDFFLSVAFRVQALYISPVWWKTLSKEKREEYKKIHLIAGKEHVALV